MDEHVTEQRNEGKSTTTTITPPTPSPSPNPSPTAPTVPTKMAADTVSRLIAALDDADKWVDDVEARVGISTDDHVRLVERIASHMTAVGSLTALLAPTAAYPRAPPRSTELAMVKSKFNA